MVAETLKRLRRPGIWPVAAFLVVLFFTLDLMSDAVQNSEELSRLFLPLLSLVLLGLLILAVIVGVNLVKLVRSYRRQAAGSRLTGRLVLLFSLISLLPVGVVYYYSLGFLLKGIDSWFDVQIDRAIEDALALNQASLDLNQRVLLKYTEQLLSGIEDQSETALALSLDGLRRRAGALELTLMDGNGQAYGSSSADPTQLVPDQPEREILQQVRNGSNYVGLDTRAPDGMVVRAMVRDPRGRPLMLQGLFPTSVRIDELSGRLEEAYNRYKELAYLRQSLKLSFSLTLSLVLVFGLLSAVITAFHTARRLVAPVADIAHGTRAVAEGDYDKQLPLPRQDDELAFLVASFNAMTKRIARARDAAKRSQHQVEAQRAYLETVLGRLSSGVMAFDAEQRLRTANTAAHQILRLDLEPYIDQPLSRLGYEHPRLKPWVERMLDSEQAEVEWRDEVTLFSGEGRQVLMCRSSPFNRPGESRSSHVVVFDDITTLIRAQRDAAWGEVARRLAHEIKNPLTPIRLSAEQLRHKYLRKLSEKDARVLDRATQTIVQQVDAMKEMVDAFSNYARSPVMQVEPLAFDRLVSEVLDLYRSAGSETFLDVDLQAGEVRIKGDPLRLRQVIHNLMKNAQEALEDQLRGRIRVATRIHEETESRLVELRVEDNGPGFSEDLLGRLFEPYVTTKAKGTGLGLAIVKKIVEEHGGIIWAANKGSGGARVILRLPLWSHKTSAEACAEKLAVKT